MRPEHTEQLWRRNAAKLCWAWRNADSVTWTPDSAELAALHSVDPTSGVCEVQFLSDQVRAMMPLAHVAPATKQPPSYRPVFLHPEDKVPSLDEARNIVLRQEQEDAEYMARYGHPRPLDMSGIMSRIIDEEPKQWGIPTSVHWALRNRSIPATQVKGKYESHFYSRLYEHNFFAKDRNEYHGLLAHGDYGDLDPELSRRQAQARRLLPHRGAFSGLGRGQGGRAEAGGLGGFGGLGRYLGHGMDSGKGAPDSMGVDHIINGAYFDGENMRTPNGLVIREAKYLPLSGKPMLWDPKRQGWVDEAVRREEEEPDWL